MESTATVRMDDGAGIYVKILGNDDPKKPLFIAQHGGPGVSNHEESLTSFAHLADRFRVLVFDARGSSGQSDLCPPFTRKRWAADIECLRIWAKADKFVIGGGSYGGVIILEYALTYPDRLTAMILRDTFAAKSALQETLKRVISSNRASPDEERQSRFWTGALLHDSDYIAGMLEIAPLFSAKAPAPEPLSTSKPVVAPGSFHHETVNGAFGKDMDDYDVVDRLREIQVPTLVVVGRHDIIFTVNDSKVISEGIPGAKLGVFESSGHSPPAEESSAFQACVRDFLDAANSW